MRQEKRFVVCQVKDLPLGGRVIADCGGLRVGVFNVDDRLFALHDRCPHYGGPLCAGVLSGTALPAPDGFGFVYGREGYILRCAWHRFEFDVETGRCLADEALRARTFAVAVEDGNVVVRI